MMRSLLVGLDGSTHGDAALELGVRWAKQFDALLVALGVVDEPGIHGAEEVWLGEVYFRKINAGLTAEAHNQVERTLERAAIRCADAGVAFKPLEDVGTPHEKILIEAQRYDLIVMGQRTHFRFGWQDYADDTLERVLTENPRPVVAAPATLTGGNRVVVTTDGSVPSARAVQAFQNSGIWRDQEVLVLSIASSHKVAALRADRVIDFLGFHDIKAKPHALESSASPGAVILEETKKLDAGLVVMGAYGKPAIREFFLGSVTRKVLKDSTVPVFLSH